MKKMILSLMLVLAVMTMLLAGTALAAGKGPADADYSLPGQDYFSLVGTIQDFSLDAEGSGTITVLLHNGNRYVKPVAEGDTQTVNTTPGTEYYGPDLEKSKTVSVHGSVDSDGTFLAEKVTVDVPCPACPALPED